jgi:hypothetical protein
MISGAWEADVGGILLEFLFFSGFWPVWPGLAPFVGPKSAHRGRMIGDGFKGMEAGVGGVLLKVLPF